MRGSNTGGAGASACGCSCGATLALSARSLCSTSVATLSNSELERMASMQPAKGNLSVCSMTRLREGRPIPAVASALPTPLSEAS